MSMSGIHCFKSWRDQRGVNLIEIMVSMVIGLFLVLGATTLYVRSKKSSDVDDSIARVQETMRYAMSVLEADIRMANYWGFVGNQVKNGKSADANFASSLLTGAAATSANVCGANYAIAITTNTRLTTAIDATNTTTGSFLSSCGASPSSAVLSADTLTIRRASYDVAPVNAASLQICANPGTSYITFNGGPPEASVCQEVHDLYVNAYYVDQGSDQSTTLPSLRRKTLISGPTFTDQEVIPGVEDMQVQLGWAPAPDPTTPTVHPTDAVEFLQPGSASVPSGGQVVAIRIWMLVRAEKQDFTYTDSHTYEYGDRLIANGTTSSLISAADANKAYVPADHYQRVLASRTFSLRNIIR